MAILQSTPESGLAGIQALLDQAQPGDSIECLPGRYEGEASLTIAIDGIKLTGSADTNNPTLLVFSLNPDKPAGLAINNHRQISVEYLQLEVAAQSIPAEDKPYTGIKLVGTTDCRISHVQIVTAQSEDAAHINGITVEMSDSTAIHCNKLPGLRTGIVVISSQAFDCQSNTCRDSQRNGIVIFSSRGRVVNNLLLANKIYGLAVSIYPETKISSDVEAEANRAEGNEQSGIAYFGSRSRVVNNSLLANKGDGLTVQIDSDTQTPSDVEAEANRTEGNEQSGIAYFSSRGRAINNQLLANKVDGLLVQIDPETETLSDVDALDNGAEGNGEAGISYLGSRGRVVNNRLLANKRYGLVVQIHTETKILSDVEAIDNRAEANEHSGIVYLGSRGQAINNQLLANKRYGLTVQIDTETQIPSDVKAEANWAEGNELSGIAFLGSRGWVVNNLVTANYMTGIVIDNSFLHEADRNDIESIISVALTANVIAGSDSAFMLIDATPSITGNLLCLNKAMFNSDSRNYHHSSANNVIFDTDYGLIHPEDLSLFQSAQQDGPLQQHFQYLTDKYGGAIAKAALGGGYDQHVRAALQLPERDTHAFKTQPKGNCYYYLPTAINAENIAAENLNKLWQDIDLISCTVPSRIEDYNTFGDCFKYWLYQDRPFPSLWAIIGPVDLTKLQNLFAGHLRSVWDDAPLLKKLRTPRYRWLHIEGSGIARQNTGGYDTHTLIEGLIKASQTPIAEDGSPNQPASLSAGSTRGILILNYVVKVATPFLLVLLLALSCWLFAGINNHWWGEALIVDLPKQLAAGIKDLVGPVTAELSEKWTAVKTVFSLGFLEFCQALTSVFLVFIAPIYLLMMPVNLWMLPPHLRFSLKWKLFEWLPHWLENKLLGFKMLNPAWWLEWRGKEWLALTVFGRNLFMPWRRNDWVVLVWDQLQVMEQPDQVFLEYLHQQARRHKCRLLVILNLYDRGLIPLCAKAIQDAGGQNQNYFLVDWLEHGHEVSRENMNAQKALGDIAKQVYGQPAISRDDLNSVLASSDFDWKDAPVMALLASSQRLPVRFSVNFRGEMKQYQLATQLASPLSLIRPTFYEFWQWLAETASSDVILPWKDDYMCLENSTFWPFATAAGDSEYQRWNWLSQPIVKLVTSFTSWRVLAVKSGYRQHLVKALKAVLNNQDDPALYSDIWGTYAAIWGEVYYLKMVLLYLDAAKGTCEALEQQELYALCSLALECALEKFECATQDCPDKIASLNDLRLQVFNNLLDSQHPEPERIVGLILHYYFFKPDVFGDFGLSLIHLSETIEMLFEHVNSPLSFSESPGLEISSIDKPMSKTLLENISSHLLLIKLLPDSQSRQVYEYFCSRQWYWLAQAYSVDENKINFIKQTGDKFSSEGPSRPIDPRVRQFRELWLEVTTVKHLELLGKWAHIVPDLVGAGLISAAKWSFIMAEEDEKFRLNFCLANFLSEWRNQWHPGQIVSSDISEIEPNWPLWLQFLLNHKDSFMSQLTDKPAVLPNLSPLPLLEGVGYAMTRTEDENKLQQIIAALAT